MTGAHEPPPGSAAEMIRNGASSVDAIAHALAAAVERETYAEQAVALGFDPGVAPQIVAIAIEQAKAGGLHPSQVLVHLSYVASLEKPAGASWPLGRTTEPTRPERALHAACNAWRHAVTFARRTLLRR